MPAATVTLRLFDMLMPLRFRHALLAARQAFIFVASPDIFDTLFSAAAAFSPMPARCFQIPLGSPLRSPP